MPKSEKRKAAAQAAPSITATSKLAAKDEAVDPALASLFASSSGPVKVQPKAVTSAKAAPSHRQPTVEDEASSSSSDASEESDNENESSDGEASTPEQVAKATGERPHKRKRTDDEDDLEQAYFKRLELLEDRENRKRKPKQKVDDGEGSSSDPDDDASASGSDDSSRSVPKHETLDNKLKDQDKLNRTVFLGNVSTQAIKTKVAKKALYKHLRSILKTRREGETPGKLESVRFRSTAYASGEGPKKATYAKKELMDATSVSTNAYAVFSTDVAAVLAAEKLNGTIVLDRHLRVDYLAKPSAIDHKRCVFIGNLSFVNEEAPAADADEEQKRRPTAKEPADAEEGLWRTFSKVGTVESVRVVRDQETRVGKGFAYVQFKDENSVEAALLLNEKKFPPMLPRKLRVMRARKMQIKPHAISARGATPKRASVFEGHRATSKKNGDRKRKRPNSKAAQRSAQYRAARRRNRN
ncbi:hypothetical protein AYL99_02793 [Fonsecaea erecta]|uniref:Nucleolar protein 12 n=1 Tax=Fonsecaea erecta TaxID=1367422 RepID=A0A178ZVW1_9EURO|nr:hypothetical protein AYL99_02793 [Fonsecaea erecta]OAP63566.1 hypothetical protein AYL99_02793 [Fonsecaea erecta]